MLAAVCCPNPSPMHHMFDHADHIVGSKASSPSEPPKNQIDFQFLNFSHPSDAKASRARRAVRSHVTRRQHAQESALHATRKAQSYHGTSAEPERPPAGLRKHAVTLPDGKHSTLAQPSGFSGLAPLASSPEASSPSPSPTTSPGHFERRIDPSEVYPEEWHPYIPHVMVYTSTTVCRRKG